MAKGQTKGKKELLFSKPKNENQTEKKQALKLLGMSKADYEAWKQKQGKIEIQSISVRLKLSPETFKQFEYYTKLAIDEGKATKKPKTAAGEVAVFAVQRLLKSDSYFKAKYKDEAKKK